MRQSYGDNRDAIFGTRPIPLSREKTGRGSFRPSHAFPRSLVLVHPCEHLYWQSQTDVTALLRKEEPQEKSRRRRSKRAYRAKCRRGSFSPRNEIVKSVSLSLSLSPLFSSTSLFSRRRKLQSRKILRPRRRRAVIARFSVRLAAITRRRESSENRKQR